MAGKRISGGGTRSSESVTLRRIADSCGLSLPTVSQIFGVRSHLFKEDTRQKVFKMARKLGYRRNVAATNLASGRTNTICILLHSQFRTASGCDVTAFQGFSTGGELNQQQISIVCLEDSNILKDSVLRRILEQKICDGVVFNALIEDEMMDYMEAEFRKLGMPVIWINADRRFNSVLPNESEGARIVARKLVHNGHRSILYVGVPEEIHFSAAKRISSLEKHFFAAGGSKLVCIDSWDKPEKLSREAEKHFKKPPEFTAVVFSSPAYFPAVCGTAARKGMTFADEFSFVFLDCPPDDGSAWIYGLSPSGSRINFNEIGKTAIGMAASRFSKKCIDLPSVKIPPVYVEGDTLRDISALRQK